MPSWWIWKTSFKNLNIINLKFLNGNVDAQYNLRKYSIKQLMWYLKKIHISFTCSLPLSHSYSMNKSAWRTKSSMTVTLLSVYFIMVPVRNQFNNTQTPDVCRFGYVCLKCSAVWLFSVWSMIPFNTWLIKSSYKCLLYDYIQGNFLMPKLYI